MKFFQLLITAVFISLTSCRVDQFSPCDDAPGMEGLLCKEFRFENNASIGYLTYYYNSSKQLVRKEYKATSGELKKYDTYTYENGKISTERSFNPSGNLIAEKEYIYDAMQNISNISHIENGIEVGYKLFEYTNSLLQKESMFNLGQLDNYTVYQYYNGETNLYRKSFYTAAGELLSYTTIEYFVNNFERHNHYAGNHTFTGYDVFDFDAQGNLTHSSFYDFNGNKIKDIEYSYNNNLLDETKEFDEAGKLKINNKFIYH